ncbi:Group 3 truncated hemoglobin ctb [Pandoraea morbifera]|uniref:Group 3 truncated hemoglobin ctb n=1 Tax=Pandoraea morbifera TaxID=2508300 RepID=A0A5E4WWC9_9BURK|nr:group III truncated hemoglobin [Pandoraea morbifera]VVE27285.1 Group 3 truncated hemoglobin ctb [Pandoraea morbifera]
MSHPDTQTLPGNPPSDRAAPHARPGTASDAFAGVAPQATAEWPTARLAVIDEDAVRLLVHTFYGRIRDDDMLGPVFREALEGRWDMHLEKMVSFWASIVLGAKRYRGNVTQAHQPFAHLSGEHFSRWLALFFDTLDNVFEPQAAFAFAEPAIRIAESLQLNLFGWEYSLPPAQRLLLDSVKQARPPRPQE